MGSGFQRGDVIFGEITISGEDTVAVVGATANESGAFVSVSGLDLESLATLTPNVYTLHVRDTSGNNATHPIVICPPEKDDGRGGCK